MSLIVNSLYSTREIFLRELISNASDALDKIRYESLTNDTALAARPELEIRLKPDPESGVLHLFDTGIGMTRADLVRNLGTIAQSGTKEFLQSVDKSAQDSFIGQFGVGFYSSFLVADEVVVSSKNNQDVQHVWRSKLGSGTAFSVAVDPRGDTLGRGSQISLHLKDDALEYLEPARLRELVHRYSEFINYPIFLWESHVEEREVPVARDAEDDEAADEGVTVNDGDVEEDEEEFEIVEETVWQWKRLNDVKPLWTRDPSEIEEREYEKFYSAITKDPDAPLAWTHFKAEGDLEFRAILYVPSEAPTNAFETTKGEKRGVKLYVRRVFITDNFDMVIPKYLSFIKGVVDASELQLNVSREILQQDRSLKQIEKKLVRKIVAMIQELALQPEKYESFWEEFRVFIKLGLIEDSPNRARLSKLLRFYSTKSDGELRSLEQYVESMTEGQKNIYFVAGENVDTLETSPLLEKFASKDVEVLYFTDPIDEYWVSSLPDYEGHKLVNIAKDSAIDDIVSEQEKEQEKEVADEYKELVDYLKTTLSKKISKAEVSFRLEKSPSIILTSAYGHTANMERILRAQALNQQQSTYMAPRKVMGINPYHPIIKYLQQRVKESREDPIARSIAEVLYDTAALNSGFTIDDPAAFATRLYGLLKLGLNVEVDMDSAAPHDEL